ncbi:hypothetical protein JRO89_XS05G0232400 [Xanthoceras sorbifolium]|uniref:Homeobox domain-containing protein n=1 Tax=Xanthoceras sorbifolium TaxID=99658 RepID=A0ABQ8I2Y5_9ROSI|nr:hypothetical protein JRO89_XS05G0232400 [Xanthoceras sorbifolium]
MKILRIHSSLKPKAIRFLNSEQRGQLLCHLFSKMGCSHLNVLNMSSSSSSSSPSTTATAIRPRLIPSPNTSLPQTTTLLALSLCNHQANGTEQSRTDFMGTSRWNPTPEQLLSLEEMYRRGLRTPSAEQIQRIAAQLRRFGKIEGKNVFYWFQNHKARERQKRRREMETTLMMMNPEEEKQHIDHGNSSSEYKKESAGLKKTGYDVEQGKNWVKRKVNTKAFGSPILNLDLWSRFKTAGSVRTEPRPTLESLPLREENVGESKS